MGQNKAQKAEAAHKLALTQPAVGTNPGQIDGNTGKVNMVTAAEMDDATALCGGPEAIAKVEQKHAKKAEKVAAKQAAKVVKVPEPARPTCNSVKKDGTPCTAKCAAKDGIVLATCVDHQPAWDRLTHEEHKAFGQWLRKAKGAEIVEVIGWWKAKQIAKDIQGPVPNEQEEQAEKGTQA